MGTLKLTRRWSWQLSSKMASHCSTRVANSKLTRRWSWQLSVVRAMLSSTLTKRHPYGQKRTLSCPWCSWTATHSSTHRVACKKIATACRQRVAPPLVRVLRHAYVHHGNQSTYARDIHHSGN